MKFTIRARLLLGFSILCAILVALGIYAMASLKSVNGITAEITGNSLPSVRYANAINTATSTMKFRRKLRPTAR